MLITFCFSLVSLSFVTGFLAKNLEVKSENYLVSPLLFHNEDF